MTGTEEEDKKYICCLLLFRVVAAFEDDVAFGMLLLKLDNHVRSRPYLMYSVYIILIWMF